jgi:hypothetical protein
VVLTTTKSTLASQASLAVALPQFGVAGQSMVVLAGQIMEGAVISRTVMVALQVDVLPQSSVGIQMRVCTAGQLPVAEVLTTAMSTF